MEKDMFSNPVMWIPSDEKIKSSQMYKFMKKINAQYNLNLIKVHKDFYGHSRVIEIN